MDDWQISQVRVFIKSKLVFSRGCTAAFYTIGQRNLCGNLQLSFLFKVTREQRCQFSHISIVAPGIAHETSQPPSDEFSVRETAKRSKSALKPGLKHRPCDEGMRCRWRDGAETELKSKS